MLKFLSLIPKTLYKVYDTLGFAVGVLLFLASFAGLILAVTVVLLSFLTAWALAVVLSVPSNILQRWAQAWDSNYNSPPKLQAVLGSLSAKTTDDSALTPKNGLGDLQDLVAQKESGY